LRPLPLRFPEERIRTVNTEYLVELKRLVDNLAEQRESIMLAGPDMISELGENVALRAIHVHLGLLGWSLTRQQTGNSEEEILNEAIAEIDEYVKRLAIFAREARDVLDDDGSKKFHRYRRLGQMGWDDPL
jgi:hypothetical protein